MNPQIRQLYDLALQPSRIIIGLMSGTSLDGLDIACCRFIDAGRATKYEILNFITISYTESEQDAIRQVFAKADAPLEKVCLINALLGRLHGRMVNETLATWGYKDTEIDLIASHGQTIFHLPDFRDDQKFPDSTLQVGDADHIASICNIITLSDFRQKHVAAGGQGAPLSVYGDFLLLNKPGKRRYLINIGGISNFTVLPGINTAGIMASDTGPGNTLSDALIRKYLPGKRYDLNGELASSGKVIPELLKILKEHSFFDAPFPKTTGPEMFSLFYFEQAVIASAVVNPKAEDLLSTICQLVADSLFNALVFYGATDQAEYYISGGGIYNQAIIKKLGQKAIWLQNISSTASIGLPPDAKEAALFAALANEAVAGDFSSLSAEFRGMPAVTFGKISLPR